MLDCFGTCRDSRVVERSLSPSSRLKLLAFTSGPNDPSARFRVRQYIRRLSELGVDVVDCPSRWPGRAGRSLASAVAHASLALGSRLSDVISSYKFSGSLFQRWMLSHFPTLEFAARAPRVLDVDDAVWQDSDPSAIRRLATRCHGIICGNSFLAERFSQWNANVTVVPTAVDTTRFHPIDRVEIQEPPVICWSGTAGNLPYLRAIEKALFIVLEGNPRARLRIVCDTPPAFSRIPASRTEYVEWTRTQEIAAIQHSTVGIMPLEDSEWARGKCSFKMLCYMACGIPAIVSPIGMNSQVLGLGQVGLAARSDDDWAGALNYILKNPAAAGEMGSNGRRVIERHYSVHAVAPRLADALRRFTGLEASSRSRWSGNSN